jgi:hypothetical protein
MAEPPNDDETKFNELVKRLLKTPPKPHSESKVSTARTPPQKDQALTTEANRDSVQKSKKRPRRSGA